MSDATYRAVVCEELGPADRLRLRQMPRAPLRPGGVRVAIKAAGVNFPDALMIRGLYQHRPELPFVPGLEAAGVVSEVAGDVAGVAVGDRVIAQMRTGGYAEEAVVTPSQLRRLPDGFSFAEGATFLVAHMTAYHALVTPGSYMIVEHSNVNGPPVSPTFGPGPGEAIEQFFAENQDFQVDQACEKFLLTFNPGGYLRKRASQG